jgi:hypothetical protein
VASELRDRLNEVGTALGYGARRAKLAGRGELAGRGAGVAVLRALMEGSAFAVPVDRVEDLDWLEQQLTRLASSEPERRAVIGTVLDGVMVARRMAAKGRIGDGRSSGETDEE